MFSSESISETIGTYRSRIEYLESLQSYYESPIKAKVIALGKFFLNITLLASSILAILFLTLHVKTTWAKGAACGIAAGTLICHIGLNRYYTWQLFPLSNKRNFICQLVGFLIFNTFLAPFAVIAEGFAPSFVRSRAMQAAIREENYLQGLQDSPFQLGDANSPSKQFQALQVRFQKFKA